MTPTAFEDLIAEMFTKNGYDVFREPYNSGFHMRVKKDREHSLIRCKSWSPQREIGKHDIIEFHAHMKNMGLKTGWFVCTSEFTFHAFNYANNNRIALVDIHSLKAILRESGLSLDEKEAEAKHGAN